VLPGRCWAVPAFAVPRGLDPEQRDARPFAVPSLCGPVTAFHVVLTPLRDSGTGFPDAGFGSIEKEQGHADEST
jgi:hypothetical protein